jgi:hypothetical protein
MRGAALVLFDAIPTGWVSNISQRSNIFVDFLLQRRLALKNHKSFRLREDQCRNEESFYSLCKEVEGSLQLAGVEGGRAKMLIAIYFLYTILYINKKKCAK